MKKDAFYQKELTQKAVFYMLVFSFFMIWFYRVHPLIIFDADDWTYISQCRRAVPLWGSWNPSRILPEILMPFCAHIAVYFFEPVIGNFIDALTFVNALVVSCFVLLYTYSFCNFIQRIFKFSFTSIACIAILFLELHFIVYRGGASDSTYMFYCVDTSCYYYYLIPALLNCSLVFNMIENKRFEAFLEKGDNLKKGCFYLILYLALFSNLAVNSILTIYSGSIILVNLIRCFTAKKNLDEILNKIGLHVFIVIMWIIGAIYDFFGERADMAGKISLMEGVKEALEAFGEVLSGLNNTFLCVVMAIITIAGLIYFFKKRQSEILVTREVIITVAICIAVMYIYTILLCAKVLPAYVQRSEYLFGVIFYVFLFVIICFSYILKKCPKLLIILPLGLCIILFDINTDGRTFKESNISNLSAEICKEIDNDLINQIIAADRAGAIDVELNVVKFQNEDNWPHAIYMGDRISKALYEYGLTSKKMEITIVPSEDYNERFNVKRGINSK